MPCRRTLPRSWVSSDVQSDIRLQTGGKPLGFPPVFLAGSHRFHLAGVHTVFHWQGFTPIYRRGFHTGRGSHRQGFINRFSFGRGSHRQGFTPPAYIAVTPTGFPSAAKVLKGRPEHKQATTVPARNGTTRTQAGDDSPCSQRQPYNHIKQRKATRRPPPCSRSYVGLLLWLVGVRD